MSELPEDAIEAAAKAIYLEHKLHPQLTFLWEDLVKSKDLANHNRVQRDRAYARAALSAAYPHLVAQAGADALAKVREVVAQHKGIDDWGVEYVYTRTLFEELEGKP